MTDSIRILSLGFASSELHMMQVVLESAARTLPRGFRLVKASEAADVAIVNWSTLNIELTQQFLAERFQAVPLISVSETGVLGSPGLCVEESHLLSNLAAMVIEALEGVETASRARPPEYVSWLSLRRHEPEIAAMAVAPVKVAASAPVFSGPPLLEAAVSEPQPLFGVKLLIVDMRSEGLDSARQLLHTLGASIDIAHDEHDAWTRHASTRYSAVLIDARIADEIGFKLCRRIAHDVVHKAPPVWMLADKLRPIERARSAHAGTAGFLGWPLQRAAVLHALSALRATANAG